MLLAGSILGLLTIITIVCFQKDRTLLYEYLFLTLLTTAEVLIIAPLGVGDVKMVNIDFKMWNINFIENISYKIADVDCHGLNVNNDFWIDHFYSTDNIEI